MRLFAADEKVAYVNAPPLITDEAESLEEMPLARVAG